MLRHRHQDVNGLRLRSRLAAPAVALGHSHAMRNPTQLKAYPYQIGFSLPAAGIIMHNDDETHNTIDLEASIHQFRIDAGDVPLAMTSDCEAIRQRCLRCERETVTACPSCDDARYCSDTCLDDDAAFHARLCGQLGDMPLDARPSPSHHRLAYFPPQATAPRFLWVKSHFSRTAGNLSFHFDDESITSWAEAQQYNTNCWMSPLAAQRNIFDKPLGHGLALIGARPAHEDSRPSDINWAVQSLGRPGHVMPVFGPVLAFAYSTDSHGNLSCLADVALRDLTHAVDAILQTPCHAACPAPARARCPLRPALKFADPASPWHAALGAPQFELTALPATPESGGGFPLVVPFSLGLRWLVHPAPVPAGVRALTAWSQEDAVARLFGSVVIVQRRLKAGKEERGEGVATGRMVFQRLLFWHGFSVTTGYGGVVHPLHVEGLLAYLAFAGRVEGGASEAGFRAWWEDWRDGLAASGRQVSEVQGPYVQEDVVRAADEVDGEMEGVVRFLKGMREEKAGGETIEGMYGDLVFS